MPFFLLTVLNAICDVSFGLVGPDGLHPILGLLGPLETLNFHFLTNLIPGTGLGPAPGGVGTGLSPSPKASEACKGRGEEHYGRHVYEA